MRFEVFENTFSEKVSIFCYAEDSNDVEFLKSYYANELEVLKRDLDLILMNKLPDEDEDFFKHLLSEGAEYLNETTEEDYHWHLFCTELIVCIKPKTKLGKNILLYFKLRYNIV